MKQSRVVGVALDCRVASLLAMTVEKARCSILAAAIAPELCIVVTLFNEEGAGKAGWPHAPGALAQE